MNPGTSLGNRMGNMGNESFRSHRFSESETASSIKILHLEDDPADADLIRYALERSGLRIEIRQVDGRDEYERELREFEPHLVLSDHALPSFDSMTAFRIARKHRSDLPFIIVSGKIGEEHAVDALRNGITDYVLKDRLGRLNASVLRGLRELRERQDRERAEIALRESEERYALAVQGANDGIWDWNLSSGRLFFSTRWKGMLGYREEEFSSTLDSWVERIRSDYREKFRQALDAHLSGETDCFEFEYPMLHRDGSNRWMLTRGVAVRGSSGKALRIAGSQTDTTVRKQAEEALLRNAYFDPLTQLPNRTLFENRLTKSLRLSRRRGKASFALLFMDLDRFKEVNDSLGHRTGDRLLNQFARRIEGFLRPGDTTARFGGDEFVVLLESIEDDSHAMRIAGRILEGARPPFHIDGHEIRTSVSVGIALGAPGSTPESLLRDADAAMYRAKVAGRGRIQLADDDSHARSLEKFKLESELGPAIRNGELRLFYQPILSVDPLHTVECEALVRWSHPRRGMIGPAEFIPVAEASGAVGALGEWVLRNACLQLRAWDRSAVGPLRMSVNLSALQLDDAGLPSGVRSALGDAELDPSRLTLEVTESTVMAPSERVVRNLGALRELGVELSIDDFGTGYSCLASLRKFPFSSLKIDRSFVKDLPGNPDDAAIVRGTLSLARALRLGVVAEGVETREHLEFLKGESCDRVQGYHFSRPLPPDDFESWVRRP